MKRMSWFSGMRRSLEPGMRYPCRAPESNHLETVRGATLQILATSPVVRTSLTLVVELMAFSPGSPELALWSALNANSVAGPACVVRALRMGGPLYAGNTLYIGSSALHLSAPCAEAATIVCCVDNGRFMGRADARCRPRGMSR